MFHNLEQNRQHYDRVSRERNALYLQRFDVNTLDENPIVTNLVTKMYERLFPQSARAILDVGCGTGFYYPLLSRHAQSIVGVDVSKSMLQAARQLIEQRRLSNCSVKECSALDLSFEDDSFDVVHCWDVLHHVSDMRRTLAEVHRVLKPGGRLICIEPNLLNPSIAWYHARRRSEWRLFTQNQFSLVHRLRKNFEVTVSYDNTIISFLNERTHWLWKAANALTSVRPFGLLSFRYNIDATKR